jgi:hypothetical protein
MRTQICQPFFLTSFMFHFINYSTLVYIQQNNRHSLLFVLNYRVINEIKGYAALKKLTKHLW